MADVELLPLPPPGMLHTNEPRQWFTADQMRAYARAHTELLRAERDTLEAILLAYMQAINKIDDRAEYTLPMPPETRSELHAIFAALTAKLAAIAAANGGTDG